MFLAYPENTLSAFRSAAEIEHIPTMEEVFQLLALVQKYDLEGYIIYSSFLPESMKLLKELNPNVKIGILGSSVTWCLEKMIEMNADAIHPWNGGMELYDINYVDAEGNLVPVRVWNGEEPFFGQAKVLREKNMTKYVQLGAADVITNVPEWYVKN